MFFRKIKILLIFIILANIGIGGYLFYLYQKGDRSSYHPPVIQPSSPKTKVLDDLMTLSQSIEAYYAKNLKYPKTLDQLEPEYLDKPLLEPATNKPYNYVSDGFHQYRISVLDSSIYGFRELYVENGKMVQR
jgi:hypothetical protein